MTDEIAVPLGTWQPSGARPLVLPLRTGVGAMAAIGCGALVVGLWSLAWSVEGLFSVVRGTGGSSDGTSEAAPSLAASAVLGLAVAAFGLYVLYFYHRMRDRAVVVGPRGIAPAAGQAFVYWEELSQVRVEVRLYHSPVHLLRPNVGVQIALLPRPGTLAAPGLQDLTHLPTWPPYSHAVPVPQPRLSSRGKNIPVVRDLDAALRHFAPGIYAGVVFERNRT